MSPASGRAKVCFVSEAELPSRISPDEAVWASIYSMLGRVSGGRYEEGPWDPKVWGALQHDPGVDPAAEVFALDTTTGRVQVVPHIGEVSIEGFGI